MTYAPQEWWMPYAQPLPTWIAVEDYATSLGMLRRRPISDALKELSERGWNAGIVAGEGTIGVARIRVTYHPAVYVGMKDQKEIERIGGDLNLKPFPRVLIAPTGAEETLWLIAPVGLRAIVYLRLIEPHLTHETKRKRASQYLIQKGYRVSKAIHDEFLHKFGARKIQIEIPTGSQTEYATLTGIGKMEEL